MLLLVYTVVARAGRGWASARTLGSFAAGVALLAAFVAIERRVAHPLVRLGILRSAPLVRANLGAMAHVRRLLRLPVHRSRCTCRTCSAGRRCRPRWRSCRPACWWPSARPASGALVDRFGTARLIAVGFAAFVAGYALFLRDRRRPDVRRRTILPTMLLLGIGFALGFPSAEHPGDAGVADHEQGLASGLVNTSFQVGGAIVLGDRHRDRRQRRRAADFLDAIQPALAVVVGVSRRSGSSPRCPGSRARGRRVPATA